MSATPTPRWRAVTGFMAAWLSAAVLTAILSAVVQTQHTVAGLRAVGAPVSFGQRLTMTGLDLLNFAPVYAALVAAGFLIAFIVALGLKRLWPGGRSALFPLAGAAAVATLLGLMNQLLGLALIPATLSAPWWLALVACGALGGVVFARLRRA
jgi:hypothetical protein